MAIGFTTLEKGSRVVGAIIGDLLRYGFNVLLPLGHDRGYDLVVEIAGQFHRVQCKKATLNRSRDSIVISCRSTATGNYLGRADVIAAHCLELGKTYVFTVDRRHINKTILRLGPARNNRLKYIRRAVKYELSQETWPLSSAVRASDS
jgi:PD-(D/E)XK endonuclease